MERNSKQYDDLADQFEYGKLVDEEVIALCNKIIIDSIDEDDDKILEAMYHAIFTATMNRDIANRLDLKSLVSKIDIFNEATADYIISILSFTGNVTYIDTIKSIGTRYLDLDIEESLMELEARHTIGE